LSGGRLRFTAFTGTDQEAIRQAALITLRWAIFERFSA
jgi:hypothetical protein